jgi:hypothetical protein
MVPISMVREGSPRTIASSKGTDGQLYRMKLDEQIERNCVVATSKKFQQLSLVGVDPQVDSSILHGWHNASLC